MRRPRCLAPRLADLPLSAAGSTTIRGNFENFEGPIGSAFRKETRDPQRPPPMPLPPPFASEKNKKEKKKKTQTARVQPWSRDPWRRALGTPLSRPPRAAVVRGLAALAIEDRWYLDSATNNRGQPPLPLEDARTQRAGSSRVAPHYSTAERPQVAWNVPPWKRTLGCGVPVAGLSIYGFFPLGITLKVYTPP